MGRHCVRAAAAGLGSHVCIAGQRHLAHKLGGAARGARDGARVCDESGERESRGGPSERRRAVCDGAGEWGRGLCVLGDGGCGGSGCVECVVCEGGEGDPGGERGERGEVVVSGIEEGKCGLGICVGYGKCGFGVMDMGGMEKFFFSLFFSRGVW